MANFCTTSALEIRMIGTDFTVGSAMAALASASCVRAENEVIKYISKRYDSSGWTTVALTPPIIVSLAEDLAIGYTYKDNARGGKDAFVRSREYIKYATDNLELIRDGKVNLTDTAGSTISELSTGAYSVLSSTKDYKSTFDEASPITWAIDPDKLEDIADERS